MQTEMEKKASAIDALLLTSFRDSSYGYRVPQAVIAAWISCGPDFQLEYDLDDDDCIDKLVFWWIQYGRRLFPGTRASTDKVLLTELHLDHLHTITSIDTLSPTPLLALLLRHRIDLSSKFDTTTPEGNASLWRWWLFAGRSELFEAPAYLLEGEALALHQTDLSSFKVTGAVEPSLLMLILRQSDPEMMRTFDVSTRDGTLGLWRHFFQHQVLGLNLPRHGYPYFTGVIEGNTSTLEITEFPLSGAAALLYTLRPDVQAAYNLSDNVGIYKYIEWYFVCGLAEVSWHVDLLDSALTERLLARDLPRRDLLPVPWSWRLFHLCKATAALPAETSDDDATIAGWWTASGVIAFSHLDAVLRSLTSRPEISPGDQIYDEPHVALKRPTTEISLVGYPRGEFGLGEDIRLLRAALNKGGIDPQVLRAPWDIIAREKIEEAARDATSGSFGSDVIFYVMPAFDTVTLLNKLGSHAFSGKRRIGFWQWELEHFPESCKLAFDLVDEIWCHSKHSAKAFQAATDKPVFKVPLPVFVPSVEPASRDSLGLPEDAFVVFTSFDGASSITRKNPLGTIAAFQAAFPSSGSNARLILKAMNTGNDSLWRECLRKAAIDPRIMILDQVMDRLDYYRLLKSCDAVLSLHRAEGFGRLMAESMALGIATIASAYSGNLDFMTPDNSWLVSGDMVRLFGGDYAFYQNQNWLEPDIGAAARALQECAGDQEERARRAVAGKLMIETHYSLETCAERYASLLGPNRNSSA